MSIDVTLKLERSCELKEQDKEDVAGQDAARVEAIRELCQGAALLQIPHGTVPQTALDAFEVEDEDVFMSLLTRSLDLMVNGPHKDAMECALGRYSDHDTLTKRRNHFLEKRDISYRTLIRHEQEGAVRLAGLMMKIKNSEVRESPSSPANLHYMQQRIADLETLVSGLAGFSQTLLKLVEEGKPLDADALRNGMMPVPSHVDEHSKQIFIDAEVRVFDRAFNLEMQLREGQED